MSEERIRDLLRRAGARDPQGVDRDASLYDTGVIDSFLLLQLLEALEGEFGIVIHNREVVPENLESISRIASFVARKRAGAEKMALDERDMEEHGGLLDRLEAKLQAAHDASQLPDEPTSVAALQDFVVRLRLDATAAEGT